MASKRIKPKAPEPFKTREEFERAVDQIARWDIDIKRLEAELKKRHQELDDEFGPEIKEKAKALQTLMARVEPYFAQNATSLCKPGQREGETVLSRYGIRLGNPTVGKDRKYTWDLLCETFELDPKTRKFVRTKSAVDKEALLKAWREKDATFQSLVDRGLVTVTQSETVWVEAKADAQVGGEK